MTQTPARDWQKDMEMCDAATGGPYGYEGIDRPWYGAGGTIKEYHISTPSGLFGEEEVKLCSEARTALPYWLQEAKERGEREQRLKEEIEASIPLLEAAGLNGRAASLKSLLSTLYPDTPAPKEGE
jgi:hypothetical protein